MGAPALSANEAFVQLVRATAYEEPLKRRAEGVTWMVWGAVTAGTLASIRAAGDAMPWPLMLVVPLAFFAGAVALTRAVWRIAQVRAPAARPDRRRILLASATFAAVWLALLALNGAFFPKEGHPATALFAIGLIWLLLGLFDIRRGTRVGRAVLVAIGIAILLGAVAFLALMLAGAAVRGDVAMAIFGGGPPLLAGLWQTWRG